MLPLWLAFFCMGNMIFADELISTLAQLERGLSKLKKALVIKVEPFETFEDWQLACKRRPANEAVMSLKEFNNVLGAFNVAEKERLLNMPWLATKPSFVVPTKEELDQPPFEPFVQKAIVPAGTTIIFHADFHGDIDALRRYLKRYVISDSDFKLKQPAPCLVFLGDYTDRGHCGVEVLYTLMRLKLANPDTVFLARGNHEDLLINLKYGFYHELLKKFQLVPKFRPKEPQEIEENEEIERKNNELIGRIGLFYNLLPVALFLGVQQTDKIIYLLCCHGGLEIGYDPNNLLKGVEQRGCELITGLKRDDGVEKMITNLYNNLSKETKEKHVQTKDLYVPYVIDEKASRRLRSPKPFSTYEMGFMWSDFQVTKSFLLSYDRSFVYSKAATEALLKMYAGTTTAGVPYYVAGIFRGHQHSQSLNDMMKDILHLGGISKLWPEKREKNNKVWDGIVCTFNVAPEVYGIAVEQFPGFDYDAHGILKTSQAPFNQWTLDLCQIPYKREGQEKPEVHCVVSS